MTLPNFLIIGSPKAGTTTLYDHLRAHPQVFMPRLKEPEFFCFYGNPDRARYPVQTLAEYEALFDEVTDQSAVGEATPHYLTNRQAPQRIHDLLPGVRLVASLRNPVDRAFSVHQMNQRNGNTRSALPFSEAIRSDEGLQWTYADRLERYFALFPREHIKIMLLEDLARDARTTVQSTFAFLGVDATFESNFAKVSNPGGQPRNRLVHEVLNNRRLRAAGRRALPASLTDRLKDVRSRNLQRVELTPADRRVATEIFRDDILRTQDLIDRDLGHWLVC